MQYTSSTHVIYLKQHTCITGVAQLAMYLYLFQAQVSLTRLEKYLNDDEITPDDVSSYVAGTNHVCILDIWKQGSCNDIAYIKMYAPFCVESCGGLHEVIQCI